MIVKDGFGDEAAARDSSATVGHPVDTTGDHPGTHDNTLRHGKDAIGCLTLVAEPHITVSGHLDGFKSVMPRVFSR